VERKKEGEEKERKILMYIPREANSRGVAKSSQAQCDPGAREGREGVKENDGRKNQQRRRKKKKEIGRRREKEEREKI
jgi:hypothetical protein